MVSPLEPGDDAAWATSYICSSEVTEGCDRINAMNELSPEGQTRIDSSLDAMPDHLINAILATEDQRFYGHRGVDPVGVGRATVEQLKIVLPGFSGSTQGGSTSAQQYVKLISGHDEASLLRKFREMVRAIKLERDLQADVEAVATAGDSRAQAKRVLLERYLNTVWFGRRSYGVQAAAFNYFDKDVEALTVAESAYLAGLIRNPAAADYAAFPEEAQRRRDTTLTLMHNAGFLSAGELDQAQAEGWSSLVPTGRSRGLGNVIGTDYGTDYFVAAVHGELDRIFPKGAHLRNGVRVYTTLDRSAQLAAYQNSVAAQSPNRPADTQLALITVDAEGRVLAMIGGKDWTESQVNLALGPEGGSRGFLSGSLLAPVLLATYFEEGNDPTKLFTSPPRLRLVRDGVQFDVYGGGDVPTAQDDIGLSAYDAVVYSSNTVMVQAIDDVDPADVVDNAYALGVNSELQADPAMPLGLDPVSPLEMAAVFAALDRGGRAVEPAIIERIEDVDGQVLCWFPSEPGDCAQPTTDARPSRSGVEAITPAAAEWVSQALADVVRVGTGQDARLVDGNGQPIVTHGKTSVTPGFQDLWFVGSACELTTAVWLDGRALPTASSGGLSDAQNDQPAVIWNGYMSSMVNNQGCS